MNPLPLPIPLDPCELARDKRAVAAINFCSLWPTAKPILQQLQNAISSPFVKGAIGIVLTAGDAYCGSNILSKDDILAQLRMSGINNIDDLAQQAAQTANRCSVSDTAIFNSNFLIT